MELTGKPVSTGIVMGEVLRYIPFAPVLTQAPLAEGTQGQAWDQYLATKEKAKGNWAPWNSAWPRPTRKRPRSWPAHQEILADPGHGR